MLADVGTRFGLIPMIFPTRGTTAQLLENHVYKGRKWVIFSEISMAKRFPDDTISSFEWPFQRERVQRWSLMWRSSFWYLVQRQVTKSSLDTLINTYLSPDCEVCISVINQTSLFNLIHQRKVMLPDLGTRFGLISMIFPMRGTTAQLLENHVYKGRKWVDIFHSSNRFNWPRILGDPQEFSNLDIYSFMTKEIWRI